MKFSLLRSRMILAVPLLLIAGCESPWYTAEPYADALIPPTNAYVSEMSRAKLADTVGKPDDMSPFGDQAQYMGDQDNYRYIHVRDMSEFWGFLGECVYKVPASDWPMAQPMPLTFDAGKWQDVTWMNGDGPAGVSQNAFLHITPSFALGAPATQPASAPAMGNPNMTPATATSPTVPPETTIPATAPNSSASPPASVVPIQVTPAQTAPATQTVPSDTAPAQTAPSQPIFNK